MNFLFRVDAGGPIGLGHFYRSLNLAQHLSISGHTITFCFKDSDFWKGQYSQGFEFPTISLDASRSENQMKEIILQHQIDVFYVDGLIELDSNFIEEIKRQSTVVFYQNITKSAPLADIFILPSLHARTGFFDEFGPETKIYQGLQYFTFHPKISSLPRVNIRSEVHSVAITAGGSDPKDTLRRMHAVIDYQRFPNIHFTFYYGNDYLYSRYLPEKSDTQVQFALFDHHRIVQNDILLSAFGVSTYEFLALGMPTISFGHQENNAFAADVLAQKTNALMSLGNIDNVSAEELNDALFSFVSDSKKRQELSDNASKILDFNGVDRIIHILEQIPK